ncbi:MAG: hypothetical protein JOZ01_02165, partial [Candidatus Eremiobacteraeota bacterium]|nr:hypothetical protein [Candidatus Eremiobacteraeota bacterium]
LHVGSLSYAYPSGRFTSQTLALVRNAGLPLAVTTDRTYVIPPQTRWELARLRVSGAWPLAEFQRALRRALEHRVTVHT